ncbi:MAG: DUF58 domain-containing protein [Chthonomonadales bacterium]
MQPYKRWVVFTASFFLVISAALTNMPQLYFMAAVLLALPLVSYLVGMSALTNVEVWREVPASAWDGETVSFAVAARNRGRLPRLYLEVRDHLPQWLEPADAVRPVLSVPAGASVRASYRVTANKRGSYRLEWMTVTASDPLGIFAFSRKFRAQSEFLVFPRPQPIMELLLSGAERYGFRDLPIAATRGSGIDPDGVREYIPGDPLRRMHWKSTARTGRLNVIEFEEARAMNVVLALDTCRHAHVGIGKHSTLEYLVQTAASLAQQALRQSASIRLITGGSQGRDTGSGRGMDHFYAILAELARVEADGDEPLSTRLPARMGRLLPGTTVIALTTGFDQELPAVLQRLVHNGVQVVVAYADGSSFKGGHKGAAPQDVEGFVGRLCAADAVPFLVKDTDDCVLRPEWVQHGSTER